MSNIDKNDDKSGNDGRVASTLNAWLCFFFGHQWYYAKGRSIAQDVGGTGKRRTRPNCVRRVCKNCKKKQQINRFTDCFLVDGDYFNGKPEWIDGHET